MDNFSGGYWKWTPSCEYGEVVDWKLLNGPKMVNTDGVLVGNSGRPPSWGNRMESWSENLKVNYLVKWTNMWSGSPNEDVAWFNGWFWAW